MALLTGWGSLGFHAGTRAQLPQALLGWLPKVPKKGWACPSTLTPGLASCPQATRRQTQREGAG